MTDEYLAKVGSDLVKKFKTRDPFEIAKCLNIDVLQSPNFADLKGMYRVIQRNRFIFINENLDERMQKIVCAHEIGHDRLHRRFAETNGLQEFMLYDMTAKPEYEANVVASEILLDTDEMLSYIFNDGYTAEQIASITGVDESLVALKIRNISREHQNLRQVEYDRNFLR